VRRCRLPRAWLVTALLTALGGVGCTGGQPTVTRSAAPPTFEAKPMQGHNSERVALAAHRKAEATASNCRASQLRLRLRGVGAGAGTYYRTLLLRKTGARPCVVDRVAVTYATARWKPVGHESATPHRILDDSIAKAVPRRALLAGERVYVRVGTANPGVFGNGCGVAPAANEVIMINGARFVMSSRMQVCTIRNARPSIVWGAPAPSRGRLPGDLPQPHLA
jgi:hypothetical protein